MEHVVFFPASDATPAFRRVASLEDAVRLVEHLRNVEGVQQVSVHALTEVPLSFRTVIKVELPSAPPSRDAAARDAADAAPLELVPDPEPPAAAPALASVPDLAHLEPDHVEDGELPPAVAVAVPAQAEPAPAEYDVPAVEGMPVHASGSGRGAASLGFFA